MSSLKALKGSNWLWFVFSMCINVQSWKRVQTFNNRSYFLIFSHSLFLMGAKIQSHVSSFLYFWIFLSWYINSLIFMTLIIYPLCCLIYVYSFGLFPIFLSYPWFLCQYPCFIFQNLVLPFFLCAVPRAVREWEGGRGGPLGGVEASLTSSMFLFRR